MGGVYYEIGTEYKFIIYKKLEATSMRCRLYKFTME